MNKFAITFRRTCKFFSEIIANGLGEILEMHSAVFNDIDSRYDSGCQIWCNWSRLKPDFNHRIINR